MELAVGVLAIVGGSVVGGVCGLVIGVVVVRYIVWPWLERR